MKSSWQLQEAKNKLSQVVEQARTQGPQTITVRGRATAVLLSAQEYDRLTRVKVPLTEFFRQSPLYGLDLEIERDQDAGRDIDL